MILVLFLEVVVSVSPGKLITQCRITVNHGAQHALVHECRTTAASPQVHTQLRPSLRPVKTRSGSLYSPLSFTLRGQ